MIARPAALDLAIDYARSLIAHLGTEPRAAARLACRRYGSAGAVGAVVRFLPPRAKRAWWIGSRLRPTARPRHLVASDEADLARASEEPHKDEDGAPTRQDRAPSERERS